jgi:hypothetical protein
VQELDVQMFNKSTIKQTNKQTNCSHDDTNRDGSQNVSLLGIQPPDVAASRRKFYWSLKFFS